MSFVYFMRLESPLGEIKIGVSSDVEARRASLQSNNPYPIIILATRPGGVREEYAVQRKFLHLRLRGEWFKPDEELLEYIWNLPEVLPAAQGALPKSIAHQESLRELHEQTRAKAAAKRAAAGPRLPPSKVNDGLLKWREDQRALRALKAAGR
jgi:hypothetical protein